MKIEYVSILIDKRTAEICDSFFKVPECLYNDFMNELSPVSQDRILQYELENTFIRQTREAIDFAYRAALKDVQFDNDHNDHVLTTQTMKTPQIVHKK
ncbi:hypothetical protein ACK8P5_00915 [Paenibacillus sp. EC2-1]|uniref:hypothetical protein n=1 Tax=Paenibacillus sp. EC2-1 TaxID=3388665 RepID=UPI003BEECFF1